jgi:hypothetical protein
VVTFALESEKRFVHLPRVFGLGAAMTKLIGGVLAKLTTPLAKGLIGHDHAPFTQEFFDMAEAETEPAIPPYRVADDGDKKPVILICSGDLQGNVVMPPFCHAAGVPDKVTRPRTDSLRLSILLGSIRKTRYPDTIDLERTEPWQRTLMRFA